MQTASADNFYRKKYITSLAFIVGVLLFLLPFVEVRCNDASFAENSGVGLAFGTDYKVTGQIKAVKDGFDSNDRTPVLRNSKENGKMYVLALAALILGVAGLVISIIATRPGPANMILGALAAILLIIMAVQLKNDVKDHLKSTGENEGYTSAIKVTVDFTVWYYLSVISFLAAAFFSFKQNELAALHDQPPKHAPQIPIHNPGEQSEFPTSPDESEMER